MGEVIHLLTRRFQKNSSKAIGELNRLVDRMEKEAAEDTSVHVLRDLKIFFRRLVGLPVDAF